jgi:nitrogen fixation-related uncharacterized protein
MDYGSRFGGGMEALVWLAKVALVVGLVAGGLEIWWALH